MRPPPRVRHEPPTIEEAIAAAEGLSTDPGAQAEIAAALMGVPVAAVQRSMAKAPLAGSLARRIGRTVVVERKSRARIARSA